MKSYCSGFRHSISQGSWTLRSLQESTPAHKPKETSRLSGIDVYPMLPTVYAVIGRQGVQLRWRRGVTCLGTLLYSTGLSRGIDPRSNIHRPSVNISPTAEPLVLYTVSELT